eukprot:TRINITY_DN25417_c0_g1_i2.p1 TRINITY_DN25417_c0_g1~~TRINITY_DN25417_c0_g1_i2.p1  ORF type:complete len:433 (-),score=84.06 TRINITY_DN25417_c0_g1_i2:40-1194(-)
METENCKLNFNLLPLMFNRDTNKGGGTVPEVEKMPSLEDFKGPKFPTSVDVGTFTLARQLNRWYWSKKGSCYGLVLFTAAGILPVVAIIFFGQAAGEMQDPKRKDVGSLFMWAGLMYACYMLNGILNWYMLLFLGDVGLQDQLIPQIDRKALNLKMGSEEAQKWNATTMTNLISVIVTNNHVASMFGAGTYVLTTQFVTIFFVLGGNFWHLRDLPLCAAICSALMLVDLIHKIFNHKKQARIADKTAEATHTSFTWYQQFLQSRFRRGREGDEEIAEGKLVMRGFNAINAKLTQQANYTGAGAFAAQQIHYLMQFAMVVVGGIFVLEGTIKLQDYAAVAASIGVADGVGKAIAAEIAITKAAKDPIKKIIRLLNEESVFVRYCI